MIFWARSAASMPYAGISRAEFSRPVMNGDGYIRLRAERTPDSPNGKAKELPLITLRIRHKTTYRYRQPVTLGPHRLMLRPRESRELRLISSDVTVTPAAAVTWAYDVSGNAVATAVFQAMSDTLVIDARAELQLDAAAYPVFDIAASAIVFPFQYCVSGALIATLFPFTVLSGNVYQLKSFVVTVLGGLGNPAGALLGGITLGIIEGLAAPFMPVSWTPIIEFALFVAVLILFPRGIFALSRA